jgi:hypothetical protein
MDMLRSIHPPPASPPHHRCLAPCPPTTQSAARIHIKHIHLAESYVAFLIDCDTPALTVRATCFVEA